jgi:hypothetical protein
MVDKRISEVRVTLPTLALYHNVTYLHTLENKICNFCKRKTLLGR